jgi:uncharacterized protein (TIGR00251 family)
MTLQVVEEKGGCTFRVHVVPRGGREEVVGLYGDALKVRLAAPPEKGKANSALQRFLANRLGTCASGVEILSGHTSRQKRVHVAGVSAAAVLALLDTS